MRYFAARIAMVDPAAIENVNSIPRYLGRLVAKHPLLAFRLPYYYFEMIARTLRKVNRAWPDAERAVAAREARGAARARADRMGCAPAHGRHHRESSRAVRAQQPAGHDQELRRRYGGGRRPGDAPACGWPPRARARGRLAATALSGALVAGLAAGWIKRASAINDHRNLREIARTIADALGVRYVVFGHSHQPDAHRLSAEGERWYFNVGTWVPNLQEGHFVYLQVLRDHGPPPR